MRPTEIEATKRHIAAWDLSPEQVRELQRLADHLLAERDRLREALLAVVSSGESYRYGDDWNEYNRVRGIAAAALAESEGE